MRNFFLGCFVASAVWLVGHGKAEETWIVVSGLAAHLDGKSHCNSITSGLGYEHTNSGSDRTSFGIYRNSNCSWSLFASKCSLPLKFSNWRGGACAGGVTGYNGRPVTPAGGLAATYEREGYGINLLFVPPINSSGNVLWVTLKRKW